MRSALPAPRFQLIYRGVDISNDLDVLTTSISYTDHVHGHADEIEVAVHDIDGRWKGSWRPEHGDTMALTIFDGSGGTLPCGEFEMDEPDASGSRSGDQVTIRGLAAPITKALRTAETESFEKQTLQQIVEKLVSRLGLGLEGQIDNVFFQQLTRRRERVLEFLKRLAEETGHYFSVRGTKAIFTSVKSIDGQDGALQIQHGDRSLIDYGFKFESTRTYSKAKATYLDRDTGKKIEAEVEDAKILTGDTLRIAGERLENAGQAKMRATSALHRANRRSFTGSVTMVGSTRLLAGSIVEIVGFGDYSGNRLIETSTHTLARSGYTSKAELVDARAK